MKICVIEGCENKVYCLGMCNAHYLRKHRYGRLSAIKDMSGFCNLHKKEHNSYRSMKNRCLCETSKNYRYWGGRGVKICDRWLGPDGFKNFFKDMGERPEGYSLDRINLDGDYCPENCRWADKYTQTHNTRRYKDGDTPGVRWVKEKEDYEANYKNGAIRLTKHFKSRDEAISQRKKWEREFCRQDKEK